MAELITEELERIILWLSKGHVVGSELPPDILEGLLLSGQHD